MFQRPADQAEQVGVEVEIATVDPVSGRSLRQLGPASVQALLGACVADGLGTPIREGELLWGVQLTSNSRITLEPGGALEYCSPPTPRVVDLIDEAGRLFRRLAELADQQGIALLLGANFPFSNLSNVDWFPKPRYDLQRAYMAALGEAAPLASSAMSLTTSTQVTLDYTSETDLLCKLRTAVAATPAVIAMSVNSPIEDGRLCGSLSRRVEYWLRGYPGRRSGFLEPALDPQATLEQLIDWLLEVSLVFRERGSHCEASPEVPFRVLLERGFEDGTRPTLEDWVALLSQVFTDVRLRSTIELRAMDGLPFPEFAAIPAFWSGLLYHPPSCAAAWRLLSRFSLADHQAARVGAAKDGLEASYGSGSLGDVARELVRLARAGLEARIAADLEGRTALDLLAPVEEVVRTGVTFAHRAAERWEGGFARSPARYVDHYRIR